MVIPKEVQAQRLPVSFDVPRRGLISGHFGFSGPYRCKHQLRVS